MKNTFENFKNPEKLEIDIPSREDLQTKEYKFLYDKLVENHKKILPKIIEGKYPFFALHGTCHDNMESLLKAKGTFRLELATFYEKEKDEFFLYKLYDMARYVSSYAKMNKKDRTKVDLKGGILVFNVEKEGKNFTHKWEHLLPGSTINIPLGSDSPVEKKYREALERKDNLLFRTDAYLDIQKELISKSLHVIKLDGFEQLVEKFERGSNDLGYKILQERFRDQEIVKQIMNIYEK
jgi:hypothetical protein